MAGGAVTFGAVLFLKFVVLAHQPKWWSLGLLPLLFLGCLCILQARARFCVVHGFRGTYHSGRSSGTVNDQSLRRLDRLRSQTIILRSLIWSFVLEALLLAF